jgi:hypothetical protein
MPAQIIELRSLALGRQSVNSHKTSMRRAAPATTTVRVKMNPPR